MAQKPDGKSARTERVTFTRPAAERIAKVVRAVERGNRDCGGLTFRHVCGGGGGGTQVKKAYFWGAWVAGGIKEIAWSAEFNAPTIARAKNLYNQDILYVHTQQTPRVCFVIPEAGDGYEYVLINAEC